MSCLALSGQGFVFTEKGITPFVVEEVTKLEGKNLLDRVGDWTRENNADLNEVFAIDNGYRVSSKNATGIDYAGINFHYYITYDIEVKESRFRVVPVEVIFGDAIMKIRDGSQWYNRKGNIKGRYAKAITEGMANVFNDVLKSISESLNEEEEQW